MASSSIEKSAEGDRVAVGIVRRVAQLGRDDLLELAGEHVLENLGVGVDPIPRDLEDLRQEELEQAVVADDLERDATAVGGQAHPAIGRVLGEPELVELAHHGRDRAGRYLESLGQSARGHGCRALLAERVDRLGVVLDDGGAVGDVCGGHGSKF